MALAILKALKSKETSVKHLLHQRIAGYEEPRPHFPLRASDLLSTVTEFCPREHALMDLGVVKKKGKFVGTSLRMTFDHGRYMEDKVRNEYLRDIVVGNWRCGVCGKAHPTFGKAPSVVCPSCGWGHRWTYDEPRFKDADTGVSGGIDLLVDTGAPRFTLVELKTMAPDDFKKLAAPLAEHKMRTALYLMLAAKSTIPHSDRVNTKEARILYVTKSFGFKDDTLKESGIKDASFSPFKEFTVQRDDTLLTSALAKAKVLTHWRATKQGMPCGICPNGLTKSAQSCNAVSPCWGGKYAHTLTWLTLGGKPKHEGKVVVA